MITPKMNESLLFSAGIRGLGSRRDIRCVRPGPYSLASAVHSDDISLALLFFESTAHESLDKWNHPLRRDGMTGGIRVLVER